MKALRIALVLGSLAGPALAAGGDAPAKENGLAQLLFFMLFPPALLLAALPAAAVYRATVSFPGRVAKTLEARPVFCRLLGVANLLLVALVGAGAQASPVLGPVAGLLAVALAIAVLIGLTGAAENLGRRFLPGREAGIGAFLLGWLFLAGVSLLPYLGFLYFLWFAAGGAGSTLLAIWQKTPGD